MRLEIARIDHVALAAWHIEDRLPLYRDIMGFRVDDARVDQDLGFAGTSLRLPGLDTGVEIIEPFNDESLIGRFLRHKGQGVHHVSVEVRDVESAATALRAAGIEPVSMRQTESGPEFFIHPRDAGGVLVHITPTGRRTRTARPRVGPPA